MWTRRLLTQFSCPPASLSRGLAVLSEPPLTLTSKLVIRVVFKDLFVPCELSCSGKRNI